MPTEKRSARRHDTLIIEYVISHGISFKKNAEQLGKLFKGISSES